MGAFPETAYLPMAAGSLFFLIPLPLFFLCLSLAVSLLLLTVPQPWGKNALLDVSVLLLAARDGNLGPGGVTEAL